MTHPATTLDRGFALRANHDLTLFVSC